MFNLNPLHLPDAAWQHGIMLLVAGVLGFLIGYSSRQRLTQQLEAESDGLQRDIDNRRQSTGLTGEADETAVLNRIAARREELNFDRIGRATAAQADDLKDIVGIGSFLEKKLNALGIYTFRQVANLNPDDVEQVNRLVEFFPGRIERDNWVGQAAERVKRS